MRAQIIPSDLLESARLEFKPRPMVASLGLGLLASGIAMSLLMHFNILPRGKDLGAGRRQDFNYWLYAMMFFAAIAYLGYLYWIRLPRRVNQMYQQQRSLQEAFDFDTTAEGLKFESGLGSQLLPWEHIYRWRESRNLILV